MMLINATLNGACGLKSPLWPSRQCIHWIALTGIMPTIPYWPIAILSADQLSALIRFSWICKACLSDLALSASLLRIFGICCLPIFVKPIQFLLSDVISKRTTFSQPFRPPSDPPVNAPWFFLRYWCYINHLLTYYGIHCSDCYVIVKVADKLPMLYSFLPYRDSKLTQLLRGGLSRESHLALICCIIPTSRTQTLSTLHVWNVDLFVDKCLWASGL